jgi:hypothetical protein
VDSLLFPDTGYNRMGKVQNMRMCPLEKYMHIDPCVAIIKFLHLL